MDTESDSSESEENDDEIDSPQSLLNQLRNIFFIPLVRETVEDTEQSANEVNEQKHIVSFFKNAVAFASTFDEVLFLFRLQSQGFEIG